MPTIEISWSTQPEEAARLAEFFVAHVSCDYISHVEIQMGRAVSGTQWSPSLQEQLRAEFTRAMAHDSVRVLSAHDGSRVVAVAVVKFDRKAKVPYAVLEDLVVHSKYRAHRVGTLVLEWLEQKAREAGIKRFFVEIGNGNARALGFFQRRGFESCSIVLQKKLEPG
jgi:N-acetylglutamate synthase-like GNAT family acetyltransferase